ncbi:MAG: hypothetical protein ACXWEY_16865 [Bacteroidia bacterium]
MKFIFVQSILLLFCIHLEAKEYPGYFITKEGTKVKASFALKISNFDGFKISGFHSSVKYFDASGHKETLKAEDAREFAFLYNEDTIRVISAKVQANVIAFSEKYYFLHLVSRNDKISFYKYYDTPTHPNSYYAPYYILQKPNGDFFRVMWNMSFKSELAGYFYDCLELANKIRNGDFKRKNDGYDGLYKGVIDYYTHNCDIELDDEE